MKEHPYELQLGLMTVLPHMIEHNNYYKSNIEVLRSNMITEKRRILCDEYSTAAVLNITA